MINQGTFEWYYERFGMITMSDRVDIIISGNPHRLNDLIKTIKWERSIKEDVDHVRKEFERENGIGDRVAALAWGRKHETEALDQFEILRGVDVVRPGFKTHPMWPDLVGDSTDFILNDEPGEVKCYKDPANHLRALRYGMDPKHFNQVQGHMECWQQTKALFVSYDPRVEVVDKQLYVQPVVVDLVWQTRFRTRMTEFVEHARRGTNFDFSMSTARDGIPALF